MVQCGSTLPCVRLLSSSLSENPATNPAFYLLTLRTPETNEQVIETQASQCQLTMASASHKLKNCTSTHQKVKIKVFDQLAVVIALQNTFRGVYAIRTKLR
jgi:hypothetical protein